MLYKSKRLFLQALTHILLLLNNLSIVFLRLHFTLMYENRLHMSSIFTLILKRKKTKNLNIFVPTFERFRMKWRENFVPNNADMLSSL